MVITSFTVVRNHLCNWDAMYLLWGTNWILTYYLHQFQALISTMEAFIQSRVCNAQRGIRTDSPQSTLVSFHQHHSTNTLYPSSYQNYSNQKDTWTKPGDLHNAMLICKLESIEWKSTFFRPSQINTISNS